MAGALLAISACGRYDPGGVSSPGVVARAMLLLGSPAHGADGRPLLGEGKSEARPVVDQEHPTIDASRNANGAAGVTAAGEDAKT